MANWRNLLSEVLPEQTTRMSTETYNFWSLILQAMVWIAMIFTWLAMSKQINEMRKGSTGQNILALVNYLQSQDIRDARTVVRRDLRGRKFDQWTPEERRKADLVCSSYDVVSLLILKQKLAPSEPFVENWGPSIRDCYDILSDYVHHLQSPSNSGPGYWCNFQKLYLVAKQQ
jgi:hypothetical protein